MSDYMLKVGSLSFGMSSAAYNQFVHEIEANWASQGRINRGNALQFVGFGAEKITLSGTILPLTRGLGIGTIQAIEAVLRDPGPQMVMDGTGRKYGYFIIRNIREERSKFITNGAPQKQDFTVSLEKYGEDMLNDDAILDGGNTDLQGIRAAAAANVA